MVNLKILSVIRVFMALWYHCGLLYVRLWARDSDFLQQYCKNYVELDFAISEVVYLVYLSEPNAQRLKAG